MKATQPVSAAPAALLYPAASGDSDTPNNAYASTKLIYNGPTLSTGAAALDVEDNGLSLAPVTAMISGRATGGMATAGVLGQGGAGGYGVYGSSNGTGVFGTSINGVGVRGFSTFSYGGSFSGALAPLRLVIGATTGAPNSATHVAGELYVDSVGTLFYCTAGGTPGTWVNLSSPATPGGVTSIAAPGGTATGAVTLAAGSNVTLTEAGNTITIAAAGGSSPAGPILTILPTPERFVDTRSNLGGLQGPVAANTTHTFQMTGRTGQSGNIPLVIPDSAKTLIGNLTVIGADGIPLGSFVTLWPSGTQPTVSDINYGPASVTGAVANRFIVGLGSSGGHGSVNVFNLSKCDYILDVTGYYT